MRLTLTAAAVLALQVSCWVPIEQGQAMESDLVKMKAEMADQRRTHEQDEARAQRERDKLKSDQDATLRRVDAKVKEVGDALEALNRAARKTGADLAVDLEKTQGEVDKLRGLVEEVQARYKGVEDELGKYKADVAAASDKVKAIEEAKRAQEAADAARAEADRRKAAERPAAKDDFYKAAKEKLDNGDTAGARQMFLEFIGKWKDDNLAGNAQYWIGETFYAEKRWREAVFEFRKVPDVYPKSEKAPDALLKIAFGFVELGLADDAKLFLEEVQHNYPKSNAAKLAKDKIAELSRKK